MIISKEFWDQAIREVKWKEVSEDGALKNPSELIKKIQNKDISNTMDYDKIKLLNKTYINKE